MLPPITSRCVRAGSSPQDALAAERSAQGWQSGDTGMPRGCSLSAGIRRAVNSPSSSAWGVT